MWSAAQREQERTHRGHDLGLVGDKEVVIPRQPHRPAIADVMDELVHTALLPWVKPRAQIRGCEREACGIGGRQPEVAGPDRSQLIDRERGRRYVLILRGRGFEVVIALVPLGSVYGVV